MPKPADPTGLDAAALRAMGIDHPGAKDDQDLVDSVRLLLDLGAELESLVGSDIASQAAALRLRPGSNNTPGVVADTVDPTFMRQLRVALGFAVDAPPYQLTEDEAWAIEFFESMRAVFGDEELLSLLRVIGNAMSRVARAATSLLRISLETPIVESTGRLTDVIGGYGDLVEDALPDFLHAIGIILRRHFAAVAQSDRAWNVDRSQTATTETLVVGFADLVGFTSFTEQADVAGFMAAITGFESAVQEIIVDNGGTLVKLIGDEAMFVASTPTEAFVIANELASMTLPDAGDLPSMRVGLAGGMVISSGGDYYGTVVNVAARIVHSAYPDAIVATKAVARELRAITQATPLGEVNIRGISKPVELFRLRPRATD